MSQGYTSQVLVDSVSKTGHQQRPWRRHLEPASALCLGSGGHIVFVVLGAQKYSQGPHFLPKIKLEPVPSETPSECPPTPSLDFWMQGHAQIERQLWRKDKWRQGYLHHSLGTA